MKQEQKEETVFKHEKWCMKPNVGMAGRIRRRCYTCLAWMEPEPSWWESFKRANGFLFR